MRDHKGEGTPECHQYLCKFGNWCAVPYIGCKVARIGQLEEADPSKEVVGKSRLRNQKRPIKFNFTDTVTDPGTGSDINGIFSAFICFSGTVAQTFIW